MKYLAYLMDNISYFYMGLRRRTKTDIQSLDALIKYEKYLRKQNLYDFNKIPKLKKELVDKNLDYKSYHFTFESLLKSPYPENNIVYGNYYEVNRNAPSIVILHGWGIENHIFFDRAARKFAEFGLNSVVFDLPYHIRRKPSGTFSGEYTVSIDLIRTIEAIRQSLIDTLSIINFLKKENREGVGLFGMSLGGLLTSLIISNSPNIKFAILMCPAVDPIKIFLGKKMQKIITGNFQEKVPPYYLKQVFRIVNYINPLRMKPKIKKENILIIESIYDQMVPKRVVENLWKLYNRPKKCCYPHGHLSVLFFEKNLFRDIENFIGGVI